MNGKPFVNADGKLYAPLAYTTYFDECGEWADFIAAGYKIFFVNVSFTDLPINSVTGFTPFLTGVFDGDIPDYSEFDSNVSRILSECPDALVFPRINISMPQNWINNNISETVATPNGGARESLYSDLFRRDGASLLKKLVSHIRSADYSANIAGYQVCGGATQEWFPHDLYGSYSETGLQKFREWVKNECGIDNIKVPERKELSDSKLTDEAKKYYQFCSAETAKKVEGEYLQYQGKPLVREGNTIIYGDLNHDPYALVLEIVSYKEEAGGENAKVPIAYRRESVYTVDKV
jgi:hypothetical protein